MFKYILNNKEKYIKKLCKIKIFIFLICINFIILRTYVKRKLKKQKKIGIISLAHSQNIGNNLLKIAIYFKILELGYDPYIIGMQIDNANITLMKNTIKLVILKKSFSEINKNDYDILMVNSDQTWRKFDKYFYDIAFLKFSYRWRIPKFVYGASLGFDSWEFNKKDEKIAKSLLKHFKGISMREIGSIKFIENHLGFKPKFVLDPTFLINKKYYLNLIKDFKNDLAIDNNYIFIYTVTNSIKLKDYIKNITEKYKYKIYFIDINVKDQIKKFIYGILHCKAVITDSYHGTIFSLIFDKPFISFIFSEGGKERFNTLKEVFNLNNRIFDTYSTPNIKFLETPLKFNKTLLKLLKRKSFDFLKRNLNIH